MIKQAFIELFNVILVSLITCAVTFLLCFVLNSYDGKQTVYVENGFELKNDITVVIDAGHGGVDGGAVGISGALEKDINLSIARHLEVLFRMSGIKTVMTRTDDNLLYKEGQESRKKFYDLKNRTDIANSVDNGILISIHQNKFPIEKYSGLQVYYSKRNSESHEIALLIQKKTIEFLQPDNNRKVKESGKNIYLLNNTKCPAVLVECGFLSNGREESLLKDEDYQRKVATVIFSAVVEYINTD